MIDGSYSIFVKYFGLMCHPQTLPRSRGSTHRSKARPLGSDTAPSVQQGNLMTARCSIILMIAAARCLFWALEQPKNSLLEHHPAMEKFFKMVDSYRFAFEMGEYGGLSKKPTWLYAGHFDLFSKTF